MSWLLEIFGHVFGSLFDSAREAKLRDASGPRWLHRSLAISYYVFPMLLLVSVLISWKITVIVSIVFIACLVGGALTEADDPGFK